MPTPYDPDKLADATLALLDASPPTPRTNESLSSLPNLERVIDSGH